MIFWPGEDTPVEVRPTEWSRHLVFQSSLHVTRYTLLNHLTQRILKSTNWKCTKYSTPNFFYNIFQIAIKHLLLNNANCVVAFVSVTFLKIANHASSNVIVTTGKFGCFLSVLHECKHVCTIVYSLVDQRREYMVYSPAVGNFPVYPPGLGIQGNSLQGLLQVSHNQCCLTFRRKKRKGQSCEPTLPESFPIHCALAHSYWLL